MQGLQTTPISTAFCVGTRIVPTLLGTDQHPLE